MQETVVQELAGYGASGPLLAVEVLKYVRDVGSYAGFAAVIGLAVMSALYFSQARDVRRLREWAGRAPERAAEEEERLQAAARAAAAAAGTRAAAAAQPATHAAEPETAEAGTAAGARTAAGAAAAGAAGSGGGVATAPPRITPRIPSQQTAVLADTMPSRKRPRWYRRISWPAPRYMALIVAGVLIVGGGAAFGVTKLLEDEPASERTGGGGRAGGGGGDSDSSEPVDPADVKVSVLNGTVVQGLAAQIGDSVKRKGFQLINVANATEQQRAESVVLYAEGASREARAVARRMDITQIERADDTSRSLAGDATVIVVVGADQTR
jgi:hypothetical protein